MMKIPPHSPARPASTAAIPLEYFERRQEEIVRTIRQLVEIESPSDNKPAVDRLSALLAAKFTALGGQAKFRKSSEYGDHLQVDFAGGSAAKPVLLLGHSDTVYPLGTLATMPCRVAGG